MAIRVAVVGVLAAVLCIIVRKTHPEIALQIGLAAGVVILMMLMESLSESVAYIKSFADSLGDAYSSIGIVLKVVGVAYICEFAASALKDAGENAIAKKVELGGKIVIIALTLPLMTGFIELVMQIADGI